MMAKLAIFTLFSSWIVSSPGQLLKKGMVLEVHDGDSIVLSYGGERLRARLMYIDAPELPQWCLSEKGRIEVGDEARITLSQLIQGKMVHFTSYGRDIYGRHLVEVFAGRRSLNLELVKQGLVTLYSRTQFVSHSQKQTFLNAFYLAQERKIGIHQCYKFQMPWHFRRSQKRIPQRAKLP